MIKELILASSNKHKAEEIEIIFSQFGTELHIRIPENKLEVDECGSTFNQNAFLKAKAYFDQNQKPVIADDSGLVLPAFPDILGVQSARFAPEFSSYDKKCEKIIDLLKDCEEADRYAYFVCVLCLYLGNDQIYFFEGRVEGKISDKLKGSEGFGYDPIFIPIQFADEGKTLAELGAWKQENSHRYKALEQLSKFLQHRD